jgi:hypothetical protein
MKAYTGVYAVYCWLFRFDRDKETMMCGLIDPLGLDFGCNSDDFSNNDGFSSHSPASLLQDSSMKTMLIPNAISKKLTMRKVGLVF